MKRAPLTWMKALPVMLLAGALSLSGCSNASSPNNSAAASETATGNGDLLIAVQMLDTNTFFQAIEQGIRGAAPKNATLQITNAGGDASKESQNLSTVISGGVDALVMSPVSAEGSAEVVRQAVEAKIPVICYNTCLTDALNTELISLFVTTDQKELGRKTGEYAAEYIKTNLNGSAKIGILNCDRFEVCKERKEGFKSALKGLNIEYVADQEGFEADAAASVGENIITANPGMNVMWAANEGGTIGADRAIKNANADIVAFGTDFNDVIAGLLLEDKPTLLAVTGQQPAEMGRLAIEGAVKVINGEKLENKTAITPTAFFSHDDADAIKEFLAKK